MKRTLVHWARSLAMGTAILLQAGAAAAVNVGEAAPAFTLPNDRGEPLALERLHGQVVYIDFWASSYLVDARGNVAFVETGFFDERKDVLEEKIKTLLAVQ